ncbi:MAG: WG repeat-containing protein [Rikenellaceae bacterium]
MTIHILSSLENLPSCLNTLHEVTLSPDFYDSIYSGNHFDRFSIDYKGSPHYMYVIKSTAPEARRLKESALAFENFNFSPFPKCKFIEKELLSFDGGKLGRNYDIILIRRYNSNTLPDSIIADTIKEEHLKSIANNILWLINNKISLERFALSQIVIHNSSVIFNISHKNTIKQHEDSNYINFYRNLIAALIVSTYVIFNREWIYDGLDALKSFWNDKNNNSYIESLLNCLPKEYSNIAKFIKGEETECSKIVPEIDHYINQTFVELDNNFTLLPKCNNYYNANEYEYFPELSSEMRNAVKCKATNKFGFIDNYGNKITECSFEKVTPFYESIAIVKKGGRYYAINRDGKYIVKGDYSQLKWLTKENIIVGVRNKEYFIISRQGEILNKNPYAKIGDFYYGRAIVIGLDGKRGYIDTSGKEIVEVRYDDAKDFISGVGEVCYNNTWYIVGYDGDLYLK